MGKNKNDGFGNLAAKRFKDPQQVALMSEEEVYDILMKDIEVIMDQLWAYAESQNRGSYHERKKKHLKFGFAKYPDYTKNMFANLSTAKFIYEYVELWKDDEIQLNKHQREALKLMVSTAYRDTISKAKVYPALDDEDRCKFLCEAFRMLDKKHFKLAKKLTESDTKNGSRKLKRPDEDKSREEIRKEREMRKRKAYTHACELIIQAYQDPKYGIRAVVREFDKRAISDKKKLKLLKKLYGDRYLTACGCILGIEGGSSDMVSMIKEVMRKMKKKEVKKVLRAFGDYYKQFGKRSFLMDARFYKKYKKTIKKLIREDIGYKKAFAGLKDAAPKEKKSTSNINAKASSVMKAEDRLKKMMDS